MNDEKMNEFVATMRECVVEFKKTNEHLRELVYEHHRTLYGNGTPGLKTEVDRLVQTDKRRRWVTGTALGAAATALAEAVRQHFAR
jgi:hypothetical protein